MTARVKWEVCSKITFSRSVGTTICFVKMIETGWIDTKCGPLYLSARGAIRACFLFVLNKIKICLRSAVSSTITLETNLSRMTRLKMTKITLEMSLHNNNNNNNSQRWAIRCEFEPVGPTLLKNLLGAWWGLMPTLRWVGSWLPSYLASWFPSSREKISIRESNHQPLCSKLDTSPVSSSSSLGSSR